MFFDKSQGDLVIRFMKPEEARRVRELIIELQIWQKMTHCPRLPTEEEIKYDLLHENKKTGLMVPNKYGTYTAVAVDKHLDEPEDGSHLVGYIMYSYAFSIFDGPHFWINSFYITEKYRNKGLGKKLMGFMKLHGSAVNITRVDVPVMNNNTSGLKFYSRYAASKVNQEYDLRLKFFR